MVLQHVDELVAEAVLERDPADVDPARHQQHLFVLDVDAAERADALGEVERLGLAERRGGEPAAVASPRRCGGFRHSSMVVQMLNVGANAKPSITRSAPSRTPISSIRLNRWSAA